MLVLNEEEIRRSVSIPAAVEAVEEAFAALTRGEARLPGVIYMDLAEFDGEVHVKGAHIRSAPYYVFKVASGFYGNPERGLPVGAGMVLIFDATTGRPSALLSDNGYLTDVRTGAAGAVAAKHLARESLPKVAMIGVGVEAGYQLRALATVREVSGVHVWSRTLKRAEAFARTMSSELSLDMVVEEEVEAAVEDADLVVTATPSRVPLVQAGWLSPGVHVSALGSDGSDKRELMPEVLARADVLVADRLEQCLRDGEIHHGVELGAIREVDVAGELGDVVVGKMPGRTRADQITICDLTGVVVQDAAVASLALEGARALGLGRRME